MKEWYLMDCHKPNITSGYESDAISEFAESNFGDVLETDFSDTVLLYNSDLTESHQIKCVIQGNSPDTQLKALERTVLFPVGTINTGMYVYFEDAFWLVVSYPSNNKSYEKVVVQMCQYNLRWQNGNGDIVQRWAFSEDFTKYSSGVSSNNTTTIGDNQYGLTIPIDAETKKLKRDMRFPIDFDDAVEPEIYRLTNRKVMLNNNGHFGRGGTMVITMSFDALNKASDHKIMLPNGEEVWICDYIFLTAPPENDDETTILSSTITGTISGSKTLKVGFERTYTANLVDEDGNIVEWSDEFSWSIANDIGVISTESGNHIELLVKDEDLIDKTFALQVVRANDGSVITAITISIKELM